jgi:hypothetical protein
MVRAGTTVTRREEERHFTAYVGDMLMQRARKEGTNDLNCVEDWMDGSARRCARIRKRVTPDEGLSLHAPGKETLHARKRPYASLLVARFNLRARLCKQKLLTSSRIRNFSTLFVVVLLPLS